MPDKNFPQSRTRYVYTYYVDSPVGQIPQKAQLVKDNRYRFAYTMWTPENSAHPRGNDWEGCAANWA
jgi:hypothetical protein